MINELHCHFSSLNFIRDIDFFGAGLLFIFVCISTYLPGPSTENSQLAADSQTRNSQTRNSQTRNSQTRRLADSQLADSQLADSQLADSQLADSQLATRRLATRKIAAPLFFGHVGIIKL